MRMSETMRRVIIGSSHAAIAALEAIHRLDPDSVTVVISDQEFAYSPTALTGLLAGDLKERDLGLRKRSFFTRMNARLTLGSRATAVDTVNKEICLVDGCRVPYDQLLIATGASPTVPPIRGLTAGEAITVRTLDDARRLMEAAPMAGSAVIVGAGLIGLEAAAGLSRRGLEVTIVETLKGVLPLYFDSDATRIIERSYRENGIVFKTGTRVISASRQGTGWRLALESGEELQAGLVVIATGATPNTALLNGSGIRLATGILVDDAMQTNVPDVYAAGDVAQGGGFWGEEGLMAPTVFNAVHQGQVAGTNMAGGRAKSPGALSMNVFNFFGSVAFSVGKATAEVCSEALKEFDEGTGRYLRLLVTEGRLVGCAAVNEEIEAGLCRRMVQEGWEASRVLQYAGHDLASKVRRAVLDVDRHRMEEKRSAMPALGGKHLKIHPEKCTGCKMCLYSCALKHTGDTAPEGARLRLVALEDQAPGHAVLNCLHCPEPECVQVCPNNAITKGANGRVSIDDDRCIGCLLCTLACPNGGSYFDRQANKSMICDLCDGSPECVRMCPEKAVEFDGVNNVRVPLAAAKDPISKGVSLCLGCPSEIALRFATKVLGKNIILHVPPSCASLIIAGYGLTPSVELACMLGFLTNSASIMTGVKRHYQHFGKDVKVVTYSGDGGTADVGFQSLSGAAERNEEIIYICNENEGYMNTGIQRSGTTPYGAWTSTTPVGEVSQGKRQPRKDMPLIMLMHRVPYVATATVGFLSDFEYKLQKAMRTKGFSYIHLLNPCPTGWKFPTNKTTEVSRMAVRTNFFPLWEAEDGRLRFTVKIRTRRPIEEYTSLMEKYSHLDQVQLGLIQRMVDQDFQRVQSLVTGGQEE